MANPNENQGNVSDPLYLDFNDHPGLVLVTQTLTGDNYNSWYCSTRFTAWKRNANIVCSWLLNVVSKDIVTSIVYANSTSDIWNDLKNRFHQVNEPRIYQLRKEINSFAQGNLSVTQYYTKLKSLLEELQEFKAETLAIVVV